MITDDKKSIFGRVNFLVSFTCSSSDPIFAIFICLLVLCSLGICRNHRDLWSLKYSPGVVFFSGNNRKFMYFLSNVCTFCVISCIQDYVNMCRNGEINMIILKVISRRMM